MMYYLTHYSSPLGPLTLAGDGEHLTGLWLEGQKYFGGTVSGNMEEKDGLPVFAAAKDWLDRYFAGEKPRTGELLLAPEGGEFRQAVWRILCEIPYGEVTTYGEIARKIARNGNKSGCLHRRWGERWGVIPFPSSSRATGWWERAAA